MTRTSDILDLFPTSDVLLAKDIGISLKTLKRMRNKKYRPRTYRSRNLLAKYIQKHVKDIETVDAIHIDSIN